MPAVKLMLAPIENRKKSLGTTPVRVTARQNKIAVL